MQIRENAPLAPFTTFGIGGPARYFILAQSLEDIQAGLKFATEKSLPVFILGGGSNLLVPDSGYDGVVIKIELLGVERTGDIFISSAGEGWDGLVARACAEGLWGVENLSGIPGTVGGAVVQNIGAYGAALSETFLWADVLDTSSGEVRRFANQECAFDYRDSIFKHRPNLVVLRAAFALSTRRKPNTSYKDLAKLFDDSSADIGAIREAILAIRKGKFPDLAVEGTAGSFFKNPIVSSSEAEALKAKYPGLPLFAMPETAGVKVPLAWFLDNVLRLKGASVGGARLYERQPLVIAAAKNTPSSDVKALAEKIKKEVQEKLQIIVEEEVKILQ
jgi:UDP-N-acetylmuramate dehydrogenase